MLIVVFVVVKHFEQNPLEQGRAGSTYFFVDVVSVVVFVVVLDVAVVVVLVVFLSSTLNRACRNW